MLLAATLTAATLGAAGPAALAAAPSGPPSDAALAATAGRHDLTREQFYFVLPDRFANGDRGNDTGGITGTRLDHGLDPADKGFYHGGDLAGLIQRLDYIQDLGTTAIWMAPIFTNKPVQGTGDAASAGYHGYWITDFTRVDPHFGTNEQLKELIAKAHARGIKVFFDVITNHTADILDNRQGQSGYRGTGAYPVLDADGNPVDETALADRGAAWPKLTKDSFPYSPVFRKPSDATAKTPAWLNDPALYHNRGDSTFAGESATEGDFSGLDDLDTQNPRVVKGFEKVYQQWVEEAGVDGFRIDTVKHVNMAFWQQWAPALKEFAAERGNKKFFMFGEVYSGDPAVTAPYVTRGRLQATLDFPFQGAARAYVSQGGPARGLAELYGRDHRYTTADTDAYELPTFLGNHDMGRFGSFLLADNPGADEATLLKKDRLGNELMFLTRGQPVVYYGDEQGFTGAGGDKDARQDVFASLTPSYNADRVLGGTPAPPTATTGTPSPTGTSPPWPSSAATTRRSPTAPRSSGTRPTAPASTPSPGSTPPSRSSTWSRSTTPPRPRPSPWTPSRPDRASTRSTRPRARGSPAAPTAGSPSPSPRCPRSRSRPPAGSPPPPPRPRSPSGRPPAGPPAPSP